MTAIILLGGLLAFGLWLIGDGTLDILESLTERPPSPHDQN